MALLALLLLQSAAHAAERAPFADWGAIEPAFLIESSTRPAAELAAAEPADALFGMATEPLVAGDILDKWHRAKDSIASDLQTVGRCLEGEACPDVARRLIDLSLEGYGQSGRARIGLINRAVDRAISPGSDAVLRRVEDHWSAPLETLQAGRGDCEDYAIVKYAALLQAGVAESDVKLVILKNAFPDEDHAVLAVRVDGEWLILDNRTLTLVRDSDMTRTVPKLVLDRSGVRRFVAKG